MIFIFEWDISLLKNNIVQWEFQKDFLFVYSITSFLPLLIDHYYERNRPIYFYGKRYNCCSTWKEEILEWYLPCFSEFFIFQKHLGKKDFFLWGHIVNNIKINESMKESLLIPFNFKRLINNRETGTWKNKTVLYQKESWFPRISTIK